MKKASAFAPGHISGFFLAQDECGDPVKRGSKNCGPCIESGVVTSVEIEVSSSTDLDILIDGKGNLAETTQAAVKETLELAGKSVSGEIRHSVQAPIGAGFGMSGAGAIGAVLALSEALNLNLTRDEIGSIAHRAEVVSKTGLGDVSPQMLGGIVIGLKPGALPYWDWEKITVEGELKILCASAGSLKTSDFLGDQDFMERSKVLGEAAMEGLLSDRTIEGFMKVSRDFALNLRVFNENFKQILEEISSESPLGASAVMLGKAIFAPLPSSEVEHMRRVFLEYFDSKSVFLTSIDFEGARILS
ncbi:hypothetical protein AKJ54_00850 [candidate division MSBL1 archaeon SCGC-AAA382K21]|uniref:Pantoate kinase n=1 Tax=candidate division MSBL1 archaeon SCGC-AAA382K21 TaxID=1698283 RepID=A0A133VKR6_9EURY|nr:hypothetical protein AKJ54_00850 [candidate division MSBL1 archaeon SCGC-AAA382K21]